MRTAQLFGLFAFQSFFAFAACGGDDNTATGGAGGSTGASTGTTTSTSSTGSGGSGTTGAAGSGTSSSTSSGSGGSGGASGSSGGGAGGTAGASGSGGASGGGGRGGGGSGGGATDGGNPGDGSTSPMMNFFVSSDTSMTANLGGLTGADMRCQRLAMAVGLGAKTWHAYLSAVNPMTNARDRIGEGPYYNANGVMLAATKTALHARNGDPAVFITEQGKRINGQWAGSPTPNEHDILTGSNVDGTIAMNLTCGDWMATSGSSQVGHTDGLGPNMNSMEPYNHWNSVHTGQCANTTPGGGAGRIYCFVAP
jgi:hypothetical protein